MRTTREIFDSHIHFRLENNLDDDLKANYAEDFVLLCELGVHHGHDGLRESAKHLSDQLVNPRFTFEYIRIDGPYVLLLWSATSDKCNVINGADSFVMKDDKIIMQTVAYQLVSNLQGP